MKKTNMNLQDLRVKSFITEIESERLHALRAGCGGGDSQGGGAGCDGGGTDTEEEEVEEKKTFWQKIKDIFRKGDNLCAV